MLRMLEELKKEYGVKTLLSYARAFTVEDYIGTALFPEKPVGTLNWEYFKGENRLPVMATVQAWGSETPIHSREGISKVSGSVVPIKRKIPLDEDAIVALRREGLGDKDFVKSTMFNDLDDLIKAVLAREEKMRMDALVYGKIELAENNVIMNVDYQRSDSNSETLLSTAKWDDYDDSNPIENIQAWVDAVESATGTKPTRALTSNEVVAHLRQNIAIRQQIFGDNGGSRAININDINLLLESMSLPRIATYNKKARVQNEDGTYTTFRFFPADKFALLPPETLGETLVGPTVEAMAEESLTEKDMPGIFALLDDRMKDDPPVIWTRVAKVSLPTFPMIDSVFVADVV